MDKELEIQDQRLVSNVTVFHVFTIFGIKAITALFTRSLSFLTELSDSVLDFTAMGITFLALKESRKPADYKHLFGHYKVNSAAGMFQSMLIVGLYCYIFYNSVSTILFDWKGYSTVNGLVGAISLLVVLVIVFIDSSIIVRAGKRSKNPLIIAQGLNFRGDLYRNITFIIGLSVSSFGIFIIDPILAGIFAMVSIIKGFKIMKQSFDELVDANVLTQDTIEEVENTINSVPGVKELNDLLIKTAGNKMDTRVFITVDRETSVLIGNDICDQIKKLLNDRFGEHYLLNTMVQLNIAGSIDRDDVEFLFQVIKDLVNDRHDITNMHDIAVDVFKDKILVQCHLGMNPDMLLSEANDISTKLEQEIMHKLGEMKKMERIDVVTHIEPARSVKKQHSHAITRAVSPEIVKKVRDVITGFTGVGNIKQLDVLAEDFAYDVSATVMIDGGKTVREAHNIVDRLENVLFSEIPVLRRCTIHAEPSMK
jgi:cation diffusion facilitator family transporter